MAKKTTKTEDPQAGNEASADDTGYQEVDETSIDDLLEDGEEGELSLDADDRAEQESSPPSQEDPEQQTAEAAEGESDKGAEQPAVPEGETTAAPEPEPQPPVATEAQPVEGAQPLADTPPATPVEERPQQLTNEQLQEEFRKFRSTAEEQLASHHYALTEEQVDELEANPEVAVPKLLSRVYMDATSTAIAHVMQQIPAMVSATLSAQDANARAEAAFYKAWPKLDKAQHGPTVVQLAQAYRHVNPTASSEEFIQNVGAQAMIALRLPVGEATVETVQETPARAPFVPASAAPAPAERSPRPPTNAFTKLDEQLFGGEELDADQ